LTGEGIITFNDNREFRGTFENGKVHGFATLFLPSGSTLSGYYKNHSVTDIRYYDIEKNQI
jgi:hypothetical protein